MQYIDYYEVLGVSAKADEFVIKAAYKSLAQRYHPDKFQGNPRGLADAELKMRQINEAYQVLSDSVKRRDYDASRQSGQNQQQQNNQQSKQQEEWAIALRFYDDLTSLTDRLSKFDNEVVTAFKTQLLASKAFEQRQSLAKQLEQQYLEDYFGGDPKIVSFARDLLLADKRDGAKELNQMIKVMGNGVAPERIIEQLEAKYLPQRKAEREKILETENQKNKLKKGKQHEFISMVTIALIGAVIAYNASDEMAFVLYVGMLIIAAPAYLLSKWLD